MCRGCLKRSDLHTTGTASPMWTSQGGSQDSKFTGPILLPSPDLLLGLPTGCTHTIAEGDRELGSARRVDPKGKGKTSRPSTGLELGVCALNTKRPGLPSCGSWFSLTTGRDGLLLLAGPRLRVTSVLDNFMVYVNRLEMLVSTGLVVLSLGFYPKDAKAMTLGFL